MSKPGWFYWFTFARDGGPTVEMVDLPSGPQRYRWTGIYGVQIGSWFIGSIRGAALSTEAPDA